VTEQYLTLLKKRMHELKLMRKLDPQGVSMANEIEELVDEVLRLKERLRQAASYLNDYSPEKAQLVTAWEPQDATEA
jgi:hypothetical protein